MNRTLINILGLLFFTQLSFSFFVSGQTENKNIEQNKSLYNNYYTCLSVGLTRPIYRDFATSPLFYRGIGINLNSAWMKRSDSRERTLQIGLGSSVLFPKIPESDFIQPSGFSTFGQLNIFYQQLWKINRLSNTKNNLKLGGSIASTQNIRLNSTLQNNSFGLENLSNLMASVQVIKDISREKKKQINLLLFKPVFKPVKRDLRFLLNIGLLNFNYRPGYAYTYDSEIIGTETGPLKWIYYNYKWSMNGWRIQTQLEYIKYLANGNARSWSYVWGAAQVPGRHETFQMASHEIRFTLFFHRKKKDKS